MLKIKEIKKSSLTDMVEEEIRKAIIEANLQPGDKLPGELEFAAKFDVSRAIVREAISRLRMLGVCESKKCRGLILTEPDLLRGLEGIIDLPVLSDEKKSQLFHMRVTLELGVTAFAFFNKTDDDIKYLEEQVSKEEANPDNVKIGIKSDINFHTRLYEMSGNPLLSRFHALLRPFMTSFKDNFKPERFETDETISHRDLLEELKNGTVDSFSAKMREHFRPYIEKTSTLNY